MEKNKNINKEIAIIHWEDSWCHGNLQLTEEECKSKSIGYGISAGIVVHEDEKQISNNQALVKKSNVAGYDIVEAFTANRKKALSVTNANNRRTGNSVVVGSH